MVERIFGALVQWGGLLRSRSGRSDVAAARLACVAALSSVEALANPKPILKTAA